MASLCSESHSLIHCLLSIYYEPGMKLTQIKQWVRQILLQPLHSLQAVGAERRLRRQLELRMGGYVKYLMPNGGPLTQSIKWCNLGLEGILCVACRTSSSRYNFWEVALTTTLLLYKVKLKVAQLYPTLCNPIDYTVHGILQARTLEWVAYPFSRGSSQPRDRTQVSHITGRLFTSEPQGKPKNTEVCSLSLLQRIFLTQESKRGLQHCRRIL